MNTLETLRFYNTNLPRTQARIKADPMVMRQTEYFENTVGKIKTSKEFVNNYRVFSYAMTAHGLGEMTYAKAFVKQMLDEGLSNPDSAANRITDRRFKSLVAAFNFGDKGAAATADTATIASTVARFVDQRLEAEAGRTAPGAQLALYFQRNAPNVTSSYQLLADKALTQVVQTVFRLPAAASSTALDNTAAAIDRRLPISDLQDPVKVRNLITRFAASWDARQFNTASSAAAQILRGASSGTSAFLANIQRAYTRS